MSYTIAAERSLFVAATSMSGYYSAHPFYRMPPFIRLVVQMPWQSEPLTPILYTFSQSDISNLMASGNLSAYTSINTYIRTYMRRLYLAHNSSAGELSLSKIPQFNTDVDWYTAATMSLNEVNYSFFVDPTYVPFDDPVFMDYGRSPNLGFMLGMDPAAVNYPPFDKTLGIPFPSREFVVTPKQPGDVRIKLTDNNRVIYNIAGEIPGDGSYNSTTGVLRTCLRRPVPQPLFSLTVIQQN